MQWRSVVCTSIRELFLLLKFENSSPWGLEIKRLVKLMWIRSYDVSSFWGKVPNRTLWMRFTLLSKFDVYSFSLHDCRYIGWPMVNYCQFLAFDHPDLSRNDHCDQWLFQEIFWLFSEAAVRRYSSKQVLLEILQYSQENICFGVSLQLYFNLVPRDFNTGDSCENCDIFTNNFFYETPLVAAFVSLIM